MLLVATKVATLPEKAGWRDILRLAFFHLLALCLERIADGLTSLADAFFVGVRIHP